MAVSIGTRRPPGRAAALLAGLAVVLAGCTAHATLTVTMHGDGSGTVAAGVRLDAEAVQTAEAGGAPLEQAVRLTDLRAGGWSVSSWRHAKDGSASIVLTKPFRSPDQVAGIARELNGTQGPLRGFTADRSAAWLGLAHTSGVHGTIDLRDDRSGVTSDPTLLASLQAHGVDVAGLDQVLTAQLRAGFTLRVVADLPGGTHAVTAAPGTSTALDASSTAPDTTRDAWGAAALALLALAILAWRRARGPRRHAARPVAATRPAPPPPPPRR